jgi:hypothetical protein
VSENGGIHQSVAETEVIQGVCLSPSQLRAKPLIFGGRAGPVQYIIFFC